jgi:hypothetical protein
MNHARLDLAQRFMNGSSFVPGPSLAENNMMCPGTPSVLVVVVRLVEQARDEGSRRLVTPW